MPSSVVRLAGRVASAAVLIGCAVGLCGCSAPLLLSQFIEYARHENRTCTVKVNLAPEATHADVARLQARFAADPQIGSFRFLSKEQAFAAMRKAQPKLVASLPYNPLPDSFTLVPKDSSDAASIVRRTSTTRSVAEAFADC